MKQLHGRLKEIAEGRVLTPEKCRAYVERWKERGWLPADYTLGEPLQCRHFGEQISSIGCQTCGGTVELKIFRCGVHEECTPRRNKEGIRACEGCADYGAVSVPR